MPALYHKLPLVLVGQTRQLQAMVPGCMSWMSQAASFCSVALVLSVPLSSADFLGGLCKKCQ